MPSIGSSPLGRENLKELRDDAAQSRYSATMRGSVLIVLIGSLSCTKVREQPTAPQPVASQSSAAEAQKPAPRLDQRRPPTSWGSNPSIASGSQADAANQVRVEETLNGNPAGLKQQDLNRSLEGTLPSLATCFENGSVAGGSVGLSFEADPSGRARNVKVTGAPSAAEKCVNNKMQAVKLPEFEGNPVTVQFPLTVFRKQSPAPGSGEGAHAGAPAQTAPAAAPAPQAPASPFVQP